MNEDQSPPEKEDQTEFYSKLALDDDEEDQPALKGPIGASMSGGEEATSASDGSNGNTEVKKRSLSDVA